jgi:HJR/Mrr/RecB family endonuclease
MTDSIDSRVSTAMAQAKELAKKEFGADVVASNPGIVASVFQGIAALEQAEAMKQLGSDICAAAGHIA